MDEELKCLSCGWVGPESALVEVTRSYEYGPGNYQDDVCPKCGSTATESTAPVCDRNALIRQLGEALGDGYLHHVTTEDRECPECSQPHGGSDHTSDCKIGSAVRAYQAWRTEQ
jgi:rubrerythrin